MECNTTITFSCEDKQKQENIKGIFLGLDDFDKSDEERHELLHQKANECHGEEFTDFNKSGLINNNIIYLESVHETKKGAVVLFFLMGGFDDPREFSEKLKKALKKIGADKVNCRNEFV